MIILPLGYFRSLGVENVCLKIAQLVEMAEAGFEPMAHFEPCPPSPVSTETGTRCLHSNPSEVSRDLVRKPCGDVITQRRLT